MREGYEGLENPKVSIFSESLSHHQQKLLLAPAGDLGRVPGRRVEQMEDLARPSEQGSEPGGGHA